MKQHLLSRWFGCGLLAGSLSVGAAHADTLKWVGPKSDGDWDNKNNWVSPANVRKVPGPADDATISGEASVLYEHDVAEHLRTLTLDAAGLSLDAGKFQAIDGILLGDRSEPLSAGTLRFGGGALYSTEVSGRGKVIFQGDKPSTLVADTFEDGLKLDLLKGSAIVKGGIDFRGDGGFDIGGENRLTFARTAKTPSQTVTGAGWRPATLDTSVALTKNSRLVINSNRFEFQPAEPHNLLIGQSDVNDNTAITFTGKNAIYFAPGTIMRDKNNPRLDVVFAASNITVAKDALVNVLQGATAGFVTPDTLLNSSFLNLGDMQGATRSSITVRSMNFASFGTIDAYNASVMGENQWVNNGALTVRNVMNAAGPAMNTGTVTFVDGSIGGVFDGGYTQTEGVTTIGKAADISVRKDGVDVKAMQKGGVFQGLGKINGLDQVKGVVKPGDGPGVLTIGGDYTQGAQGVLQIDIAGRGVDPATGEPEAGRLAVGRDASISGVLSVDVLGAFEPATSDMFEVLTAGEDLSGHFSNAVPDQDLDYAFLTEQGWSFEVLYDEHPGGLNDVILTDFAAVSEPWTAPLLGTGAGLLMLTALAGKRARAVPGGPNAAGCPRPPSRRQDPS